jgi:selenocysteine lyase/cysteine desulfurase
MGVQAGTHSKNGNRAAYKITASVSDSFFSRFRKDIIGYKQSFESPFGEQDILYADWTASGRGYRPIEESIQKNMMPFLANTHTGTTVTGTLMARAYQKAKEIIKEHCGADSEDVLLFCGSGMTAAVNKLQRIVGLRFPEQLLNYLKKDSLQVDEALRPVVFVTHMEHHSNHTSWLETIATVEVIQPAENGNVDLAHFKCLLERYKDRKNKIAAITACSNVTGIVTPYYEVAKIVHDVGGLCFVDFACSAPYVNIDMHPDENGKHLDAIYFSPHKFLGGPGTPGVLIFNKVIYNNSIPDQPGGGTVLYSNPWKGVEYINDIEQREDGGTPPLLQGIKAAMCIRLKETMGVKNILRREKEMLEVIFNRVEKMKNVKILEGDVKDRLGIVSFIVAGAHYNLIAKLLNDRFGIQVRGGCSCAGTYGHLLLNVGKARSREMLKSIRSGDLSHKPGWIRLSVHPVMSNAEIDFIMNAIEQTAAHFRQWGEDYSYNAGTNEFLFNGIEGVEEARVADWFDVSGMDEA